MYDSTSAFTHDGFESTNMGNDHVTTAPTNPVALSDALINNDNIQASDNTIEHHGSSNIATTFCENVSVKANVHGANPPPPQTLVDTVPSEESDCDNAAPEEVPAHRIKPEKNNQ